MKDEERESIKSTIKNRNDLIAKMNQIIGFKKGGGAVRLIVGNIESMISDAAADKCIEIELKRLETERDEYICELSNNKKPNHQKG